MSKQDPYAPEDFELAALGITREEYDRLLVPFKQTCTCWVNGCGKQSERPVIVHHRTPKEDGTKADIHWDMPDYAGSVHKCSNPGCLHYVCREHRKPTHSMEQSWIACSTECDNRLSSIHAKPQFGSIIWGKDKF